MSESKVLYKYLGGGALIHVPARDITEADVEARHELWLTEGIDEATLFKSGLYQKVETYSVEMGDEDVPVTKPRTQEEIEKAIKEYNDKPAKKSRAAKEGE